MECSPSRGLRESYNITLALIAFGIGLLLSFAIFAWANLQINDLKEQFAVLTSANVGNIEDDVLSHLGPSRETISPGRDLRVPGYSPTPSTRTGQRTVLYRRGRDLLYVFYGQDNKVTATFIAERSNNE